MSRSLNAKKASVNKIKTRKIKEKPRGQEGTHRIRNLTATVAANVDEITASNAEKKSIFNKIFSRFR